MTAGENQSGSLLDPVVHAAIQQAERMVRLEAKTDAILDHCQRIDSHLAVQNGRIAKNEDLASTAQLKIDTLVRQREDRNEFSRLMTLEEKVHGLERRESGIEEFEKGGQMVTKKYLAAAGFFLTLVVSLINGIAWRLFS